MTHHHDRTYWLQTMIRIADPVLEALSNEQLKTLMPIGDVPSDRKHYTHLEAFGRLVC